MISINPFRSVDLFLFGHHQTILFSIQAAPSLANGLITLLRPFDSQSILQHQTVSFSTERLWTMEVNVTKSLPASLDLQRKLKRCFISLQQGMICFLSVGPSVFLSIHRSCRPSVGTLYVCSTVRPSVRTSVCLSVPHFTTDCRAKMVLQGHFRIRTFATNIDYLIVGYIIIAHRLWRGNKR